MLVERKVVTVKKNRVILMSKKEVKKIMCKNCKQEKRVGLMATNKFTKKPMKYCKACINAYRNK